MDSLVNNQVKKNKIKGLVILIASLLLCALIIWIIRINKVPSVMEMNLGNNLIKVEKDNKYGYINTDGTLVLDFIYDNGLDFFYKYGFVKKDNICYLIDEQGSSKLESSTCDISYVKDIGEYLVDGKLYNYKLDRVSNYSNISYLLEGFYLFKDNNISGIINYKGKLIYKEDNADIEIIVKEKDDYLNGLYAVIKNNNKYGIINIYNGMIIVEYQDKKIEALGNNFFKMNNEYLYLEENRIQFKSKYEISFYNIKEKVLKVNNRLYSVIKSSYVDDIDVMYLPTSEKIENKTGIEKIITYNGVGLRDKNKKVVVSPIYEDLKYIDYELFKYIYEVTGNKVVLLLLDGKTYLYSFNNKKILYVFDSTNIEVEEGTSFIKYTDNNGNNLVYNLLTNKYGYYKEENTFNSNYMSENDKIYNVDLDKIY